MKNSILILIICLSLSCGKQVKVDMKIANFTGRVNVNTDTVKNINMVLKTGDSVETTDNSTCDIIIKEKNILRLFPGTKLRINISENENIFTLEKGVMAGVIRKVFTKTGKFTIMTPTVSASVKGTSFFIKVENEKSTYFCTCNGSIELTGKSSSISATVASAHHAARKFSIDRSGALIEDNTPGVLYHSDEVINEIAGVIGEKISWNAPDVN